MKKTVHQPSESRESYFQSRIQVSRSRNLPAHLLLLPIAFGVAGGCTYALVGSICHLASITRGSVSGFSSYSEGTKVVILIPLLIASIPLGYLGANLIACLIPPARAYFEREVRNRSGGDFAESMRGLLKFVAITLPPLLAISAGAALSGTVHH